MAADPADLCLGRLELRARDAPHIHLERAVLADHVGTRAAGDHADIDRDARPAPVEGVQVAHDAGRLEDRAPALLRLHAGMGGASGDGDAQVEDALARRDDVAVRAGAFEDERRVHGPRELADVRGRGRRADLLVRVGDEHEALERQAAELAHQRLERVQPGEQPGLHVGHAGSAGDAVGDGEGPCGGRARVEDRVHVPDQQDPRAIGAARRTSPRPCRRGDPPGPAGPRPSAPRLGEELGRPAADLVDPFGRVAAAVDVDEALEVAEVAREVRGDGVAQGVELGCQGAGGGCVHARESIPGGPVPPGRLGRLRRGVRLLSCPDRATDRDPPPRGPERLPARAGREARGRHRAAADLVRPARSGPPCAGPARGVRPAAGLARRHRRGRRLDPAPAVRPRRGPRRRRRPSLVGPGPLDRDVPVGRRGTGADPDRGRARPRGPRRLAVADGPPDRQPGTAARPLVRADPRGPDDARRPGSATPTGGCRSSRSRARTARAP